VWHHVVLEAPFVSLLQVTRFPISLARQTRHAMPSSEEESSIPTLFRNPDETLFPRPRFGTPVSLDRFTERNTSPDYTLLRSRGQIPSSPEPSPTKKSANSSEHINRTSPESETAEVSHELDAMSELSLKPRPHFNSRGNRCGSVFSSKQVRKILRDSGFFDPSQINGWRDSIVVPPGKSHLQIIYFQFALTGATLWAKYVGGSFIQCRDMTVEEIKTRNLRNGFRPKTLISATQYNLLDKPLTPREGILSIPFPLPGGLTPHQMPKEVETSAFSWYVNPSFPTSLYAWVSYYGTNGLLELKAQLEYFMAKTQRR
jgi:hypothetical protein